MRDEAGAACQIGWDEGLRSGVPVAGISRRGIGSDLVGVGSEHAAGLVCGRRDDGYGARSFAVRASLLFTDVNAAQAAQQQPVDTRRGGS